MGDIAIPFPLKYARQWMTGWLLLSDLASILLTGVLAILLRRWIDPAVEIVPVIYMRLSLFLLIFPFLNAILSLYPTVGLSPVEELRRLTYSTSIGILLLTGLIFWSGVSEQYSRLIFAFTWILALCLVPLCRWITRALLVRLRVWGEPVAVLGYGPQTFKVVNFLLRRMRFGLRPFIILTDEPADDTPQEPLPVFPLKQMTRKEARQFSDRFNTAIVVVTQLDSALPGKAGIDHLFHFRNLILVYDQPWIGSLGIVPYDMEGMLGLAASHNLRNAPARWLKRVLDTAFSLVIGLLLLPWLGLIALCIRLDSPGPALYRQERVGRWGKQIMIWKFRSMRQDADRILEDYLQANPLVRQEWETNQKIKNDPRVTRVGKILRRFSLDELPQIWNVLRGEMSLVGPRPITPDQIVLHDKRYSVYKRVRPGLTGLWQVSGRADLSFQERSYLDEYYVRNWSIWLDIYILIRTIWAVLRHDGAY